MEFKECQDMIVKMVKNGERFYGVSKNSTNSIIELMYISDEKIPCRFTPSKELYKKVGYSNTKYAFRRGGYGYCRILDICESLVYAYNIKGFFPE